MITGFPPIAGLRPRVLVLGSIPGEASLAKQQYYGHPRNAFWPLMEQLLGIPASASYLARTQLLADKGVALWDVLYAAERPGSSLDAAITAGTETANDIPGLIRRSPLIRAVFFNGGTAERLFKRQVLPQMPPDVSLTYRRLPSTSPAYAAMRLEQKCEAWRAILEALR